ncbi:universal stress protein [Oceanobacillus saliphilus]|uniref:universal stress protein n=1 Tax=Oceanobacillus saliphilus TaxID=2925834 RepID=UPI00201DC845|nr:universal stress protein [Oceanobacillus saliphilus]
MTVHYKSILVAVDGSKEAEYAFRKSLDVAYEHQGSQLNIVNIIDTRFLGPLDKELAVEVKEKSRQTLDRYKARAAAFRVENVNIIIEYGSPRIMIPNEIATLVDADLIICGATGRTQVERYLIGSVSQAIVRSAKCDVLVIRTPAS